MRAIGMIRDDTHERSLVAMSLARASSTLALAFSCDEKPPMIVGVWPTAFFDAAELTAAVPLEDGRRRVSKSTRFSGKMPYICARLVGRG